MTSREPRAGRLVGPGPVGADLLFGAPGQAAARGKVTSFDAEVGLGEVESSGGLIFPFHCTEIAGGSRDIAVGTEVGFVVVPGHRGRWEARALVPTA